MKLTTLTLHQQNLQWSPYLLSLQFFPIVTHLPKTRKRMDVQLPRPQDPPHTFSSCQHLPLSPSNSFLPCQLFTVHTRIMFRSNTTIYYTKLRSLQHVSTLMSHRQAIQRTNPRHIMHWSAFWDPKRLQ